jgi:diphthamide synthase (EF-2-diphthine--ammonia ligase)
VKTVVSVSGGKDSTALLALAVVQEVPGLLAVFADTGHEHPPKGALNVIFGNHSTCVRRSARWATASGRTPSTN